MTRAKDKAAIDKPANDAQPYPNARRYLKETQPETWRVAADMAEVLGARLEGKPWVERAYLVDAFVRDLAEEVFGIDALDVLVMLSVQPVGPEDSDLLETVGQTIAGVRSIFTAAFFDLPPEDQAAFETVVEAEQAVLHFFSERPEHLEAARTFAAGSGADALANALTAFPGLIAMFIADRVSGPTMEPLTTVERLRALYAPEGEGAIDPGRSI
ncbi:MAG: hypothetical protein AAGF19_05050 [Pseudomonadota bacterium]